jgi:hypothetical protein
MRAICFIIAFSFALVGPSFSGTTAGDLPGIGTFSYNGAQATADTPAFRTAHLTLTRRA